MKALPETAGFLFVHKLIPTCPAQRNNKGNADRARQERTVNDLPMAG